VVLEKMHEGRRRQVERRRATRLPLPRVPLALIEKAVLDARDQFLRRAGIVRVVRLAPPGQRDERRVVEVVVQDRIDPVTTRRRRADERGLLRFVLGSDEQASFARDTARTGDDLRKDMLR
jgi:hypothetical protein